jgi:hypothetical protein
VIPIHWSAAADRRTRLNAVVVEGVVPTIVGVTPADSVADLAQNLAEEGMVMKAVLIYDVIDEAGERNLNFVVTEKTATWDLQGMLTGILDVTGLKYRKPR